MNNLDILIAEDNPKDFEFLEQLLRSWDEPVDVTRAPNGQVALELGLARTKPLVISDIQMPEMNGIEVMRKTQAAGVETTFLMITAYASVSTAIEAMKAAGVPTVPGSDRPIYDEMEAEEIFANYVRYIGIGGIFMAGIISIVKMSPVMVQATGKAFTEIRKLASGGLDRSNHRTDTDIPMGVVALLTAIVACAIWVYFRFSVLAEIPGATRLATLSLILTLVISFLFAAVSAWAVAMISVTPISGMTLTTLIVAAVILAKLGLSGPEGMLATLLIGGVVCTALSMTGSLVTEFKISYWLGATPRRIQWANILAAAVASITVTAAIMLFASTKGYVASPAHPEPMPAPQANAMAAVIQSVTGTYWVAG